MHHEVFHITMPGDVEKDDVSSQVGSTAEYGTATTPETVICEGDPGDDTTQRFRYQWSYGAMVCLSLLDTPPELEFVYCEHHEDVLGKYTDGTFCGVQVKTRAEGFGPFKSSDDPIKGALKRFVALAIKFPGQFRRFSIATNCGFWSAEKTKQNLGYILNQARMLINKGEALDGEPLLRDLLAVFREVEGCDDTVIEAVIVNVELQKNLPHLDGIDTQLAFDHLTKINGLGDLPPRTLSEIANALVDRVGRASSHACEQQYKDYAAILINPQEARAKVIIEGKKIDAETVRAIISPFMNPTVLLRTGDPASLSRMPIGMKRMERKMAAGLISATSILNAQDQKAAAEFYGLETLSKWGEDRAQERWTHIRSIVRNECQEAYDESEDESSFGRAMLMNVRQRLRARHEAEKAELFGYRYEHLLGIASLLTEECLVWWSKPFDLEEA